MLGTGPESVTGVTCSIFTTVPSMTLGKSPPTPNPHCLPLSLGAINLLSLAPRGGDQMSERSSEATKKEKTKDLLAADFIVGMIICSLSLPYWRSSSVRMSIEACEECHGMCALPVMASPKQ